MTITGEYKVRLKWWHLKLWTVTTVFIRSNSLYGKCQKTLSLAINCFFSIQHKQKSVIVCAFEMYPSEHFSSSRKLLLSMKCLLSATTVFLFYQNHCEIVIEENIVPNLSVWLCCGWGWWSIDAILPKRENYVFLPFNCFTPVGWGREGG